MRVSPFVYFNQQEVETVIPFPTLNGSVWEVWETDSGLTLSGSSVTAWVGKENGRTLNYGGSIPPIVSSSNANFNSYDSVAFDRTNGNRMFITGSDIQGVNTGSLHFCVYAITKDVSAATSEGQFGMGPFTSPFNFIEAYLFANSPTRQQIYRFQPSVGGFIESDNDTYGKGIYTISQGTGTNGGKYFNKGTTENAVWTITNYVTTRVLLQLGGYDSTSLAGSIDIVAAVVWTNSTNLTADITSLQNYFQTKYGT
jgi:hypothetical protein